MKKAMLLLIFFHLFQRQCVAQERVQPVIDSLLQVIKSVKEDSLKISILHDISNEYIAFSRDSDLYYAREAYNISLKINGYKEKIETSNWLSSLYLDKGKNDMALEFALGSLQFAEASKNKIYMINANEYISRLYSDYLINFSKGLEFGEKALKIAKEVGDKHIIIDKLESIASIYFNFGKYDKALKYTQEEYKTALLVNAPSKMVKALSGLGDCYREKKDYALAVSYYNQAIAIDKAAKTYDHLAFSYNNIAVIYVRVGDFKKAKDYILLAIGLAEAYKMDFFLSVLYRHLSFVYKSLKDYQNALKYNQPSIQIEDKRGGLPVLATLYLANAEINDSLGNYQKAYHSLNKYIAINTELENNATRNKILEIEVALASEKKQKEIDLIQKDKELQKIIRNSFIGASILLTIMIFILINRVKLKRSIVIERMRTRLSRDLHDDIGSTLSSINILSQMAKHNAPESSDSKTTDALEKINERSQRLLDNMSDIVWSIKPENDTLDEMLIRMRQYATGMLESKGIDYTIDFPTEKTDIKLPLEVKNNIYLIFKEAVNNLCKYAQCRQANLTLRIENKKMTMIIQDDGIGFYTDTKAFDNGGNGLKNMRQRAAEIKATLEITSRSGKGTKLGLVMLI